MVVVWGLRQELHPYPDDGPVRYEVILFIYSYVGIINYILLQVRGKEGERGGVVGREGGGKERGGRVQCVWERDWGGGGVGGREGGRKGAGSGVLRTHSMEERILHERTHSMKNTFRMGSMEALLLH